MTKSIEPRVRWSARAIGIILPFTLILLLIELFDELHYGVQSAALPALRDDLGMSYAQAGILLGLPGIIAAFIEAALMLIGDTRWRKALVLGGGLCVAGSALALGAARSFPPALLATIIAFPASGAFVTLSQATLMDLNPGREAQMMARWTVFGAAGNLLGPILLAALYRVSLGWRSAYGIIAGLALALVLLALPQRFRFAGEHIRRHPERDRKKNTPAAQPKGSPLAVLWQAVRAPGLLRWLILTDFADLLLDVYLSYAALYLADVVGLPPARLALVMTALMAAGLAANLALIPLLERVPGRRLVRVTAWLTGGLYIAWLLAPWVWAKIGIAILLRMSALGWYEVLQGEAYATLPGRSGMVMAINSVTELLGAGMIWMIGQAAESFGLQAAMWLLLAGPLALILWIPGQWSVVKLD